MATLNSSITTEEARYLANIPPAQRSAKLKELRDKIPTRRIMPIRGRELVVRPATGSREKARRLRRMQGKK